RFVGDETEALAAVLDAGFDGHREAVVIGENLDILATGPRDPYRPAHIAVDTPEVVAIDVDVQRPSLLVLADAFAPGWRVAVAVARHERESAVAVACGERRPCRPRRGVPVLRRMDEDELQIRCAPEGVEGLGVGKPSGERHALGETGGPVATVAVQQRAVVVDRAVHRSGLRPGVRPDRQLEPRP